MGAKNVVRLHRKDGTVNVQSLRAFALANECTTTEAKRLLAGWVTDGALRERKDGGYDVLRHIPAKKPSVVRPT